MRECEITGIGYYVHCSDGDTTDGPMVSMAMANRVARYLVDAEDVDPDSITVYCVSDVCKLPESLENNGE